MGPAAGINGGNVVFTGKPKDLLKSQHSLTGRYFSGKEKIDIPDKRRPGNGNRLIIKGASGNNLKDIHAEFPLGCFSEGEQSANHK
jgi:excinuclease ABC subunit A